MTKLKQPFLKQAQFKMSLAFPWEIIKLEAEPAQPWAVTPYFGIGIWD